jgi:hypothetical protein
MLDTLPAQDILHVFVAVHAFVCDNVLKIAFVSGIRIARCSHTIRPPTEGRECCGWHAVAAPTPAPPLARRGLADVARSAPQGSEEEAHAKLGRAPGGRENGQSPPHPSGEGGSHFTPHATPAGHGLGDLHHHHLPPAGHPAQPPGRHFAPNNHHPAEGGGGDGAGPPAAAARRFPPAADAVSGSPDVQVKRLSVLSRWPPAASGGV